MVANRRERERTSFSHEDTKKRRSFERRQIVANGFCMEARGFELSSLIFLDSMEMERLGTDCTLSDTPADTPCCFGSSRDPLAE